MKYTELTHLVATRVMGWQDGCRPWSTPAGDDLPIRLVSEWNPIDNPRDLEDVKTKLRSHPTWKQYVVVHNGSPYGGWMCTNRFIPDRLLDEPMIMGFGMIEPEAVMYAALKTFGVWQDLDTISPVTYDGYERQLQGHVME